MSSDLTSALSDLAQSSQRLNDLTDQSTCAVRNVEKLLTGFSIGIEVSTQFGRTRKKLESTQPPNATRGGQFSQLKQLVSSSYNDYRHLEYRRIGKDKAYRIVVRDYDNSLINWDELPRDLKIQAVTALPMLIRQLAGEIQMRIQQAENALAEVSQVLQENL